MGFIYLLTHILAESAGKTFDKLNFKKTRINPRLLMFLIFVVMTIVLGVYIYLTRQPFPHFTTAAIIVSVAIAIISFGGNLFDFLSLKLDDLSLREPLVDFEPILAGLLGYILFPSEREPAYLVAFVLGAFIVRWGIHRRRLTKSQQKGMGYLWIGTFLYACLPSLYNQAFEYMTPSYVALFRVIGIIVLMFAFFPLKRLKRTVTLKRLGYSTLSGIVYAVGTVTSLYAIKIFGVGLSMLFFMLGPALRYLASYFVLRERVRRGEIISSLMLTLVVAVAAFAS